MNSCWSFVRICPTIRPRRSSTAPRAASPRVVARSSRSRPGGADVWRYPIDRHREGSYHILIFEAPAEAIAELERSLLITEEVLRHLVTRVERPIRSSRRDGSGDESADGSLDIAAPPPVDEIDDEDEGERIDESESEAAPAAIE